MNLFQNVFLVLLTNLKYNNRPIYFISPMLLHICPLFVVVLVVVLCFSLFIVFIIFSTFRLSHDNVKILFFIDLFINSFICSVC